MKWKLSRSVLVCLSLLLVSLCMIYSPINEIKAIGWDDDFNGQFGNDTIVRFGLYSYEDMGVTLSQPDYFFDHIRYGLAHSIYNYYKTIYGDNSNFPSEVSIFYNRLVEYFGSDFFTLLSEQRFLCNAYVDNNYVYICFNRVPETNSMPIFERIDNGNNKLTFYFKPQGYKTSFWFYTFSNYHYLWSFCPYFERGNLSNSSGSYIYEEPPKFTSLQDYKDALSNSNLRSFVITLQMSLPSLTFSQYITEPYNAYYDAYSLKAFGRFITHKPLCIMSDFPVYSVSEHNAVLQDGNYFRVYYNKLLNPYWNEEMSPIIISGYPDIPQSTPTPTFTPTPQPTWTPYPTATPFPPVNEIEGISQMMTLFTRKYEFNINGNVIGIRPLYLFVFTFLVGAIFKAIQGGDRN